MENPDLATILAAILHQEGGTYELKQESIDAVGTGFSVDIPTKPIKLDLADRPLEFYYLTLDIDGGHDE